MNPAPRPPSPTARDATQKAMRRENPNQLSNRDARILMGLPSPEAGNTVDPERRIEPTFSIDSLNGRTMERSEPPPQSPAVIRTGVPPRPSREMRRPSVPQFPTPEIVSAEFRRTNTLPNVMPKATDEPELISWINVHLSDEMQQATDLSQSLATGLVLYRLAEAIKGKVPSDVPDSAFPVGPYDEKLDGLFVLFDFLLDNEVRMGNVSINDVRQGNHDKIAQLVRALKSWEDKRKSAARAFGKPGVVSSGPWIGAARY